MDQIKTFWDLNCQQVVPTNYSYEDEDPENIEYYKETDEPQMIENYVLKAIIRGIKTSHDERLVYSLLESIKKLVDMDELYGMSDEKYNYAIEESFWHQFDDLKGEQALNNCIDRFQAHELTGQENHVNNEGATVFILASQILEKVSKMKEKENDLN